METEDRLKQLEDRVRQLEEYNDSGVLNLLVCGLPKRLQADFFEAVEQGVADYFGIDRKLFFDRLMVGNPTGKRGRSLPADPANIDSPEDRHAVARLVLYAVLHVDFCVSVQQLSEFYNARVKNYLKEWKARYLRIYNSPDAKPERYDHVYKTYWSGAHRSIIAACERAGLYDALVENLKRLDMEGNFDDLYLLKWGIDIGPDG